MKRKKKRNQVRTGIVKQVPDKRMHMRYLAKITADAIEAKHGVMLNEEQAMDLIERADRKKVKDLVSFFVDWIFEK